MKKVVCVKNIDEEGTTLSLTIGKVYEHTGTGYTIDVINDKGKHVLYLDDRFRYLDEVRSERIDKLLR
jgi:hypothetical protein